MKSPNRFLLFGMTTAAACGVGRVLLGAMTLTCSSTLELDSDTTAGASAAGDAAKTIAAASSTLTYTIAGATASKAATITLPSSASMTGPGTAITVNTFTKNPTSVTTNASGGATFTVGATRAALSATQAVGSYSATISVQATVNGTSKTVATCGVHTDAIASITATKTTDLDFGDSAPGDSAYAMSPSTSPSRGGGPSRGQFAITGQANTAYTVAISPASVTMTTGTGGANKTIAVSSLTYYSTSAASSSSAKVGAGGADTLYLAGTQAAIGASQVAGNYVSPNITVTITYQ